MNAPEPRPNAEHQTQTVYESLMRSVLRVIKEMPKEWKRMKEVEQDGVLARLDYEVKDAVRKAVELIAADGRPNIVVELEQVTFKDGVKATVKMTRGGESRHELADAVGGNVILVIADAQPYTKGERPAAEPEQQDLNLGKNVEHAMTDAEKKAAEEEKEARDEPGCLASLHEIGFEVTAEEIAGWTIEQIVEARAFAAAYKNMQDGEQLPVPELLKGKKRQNDQNTAGLD